MYYVQHVKLLEGPGAAASRPADAVAAIFGALVVIAIVGLSLLQVRTDSLHDDWQSVRQDAQLAAPVQVEGVEFLSRMSFEAYKDMPLFLKLGFAFGIFEQNTVFVPERVS